MISLAKKRKKKKDSISNGPLTRWRNLQRFEDDRTSVTLPQDRLWVDHQGSSSSEKDLRVKGSRLGVQHHRRVISRAREVTLALHSALMRSHVKYSALFWARCCHG